MYVGYGDEGKALRERERESTHLSLANLGFVAANRNTPSLQEALDLAREVRLTWTHQEMVLLVKLLQTHAHTHTEEVRLHLIRHTYPHMQYTQYRYAIQHTVSTCDLF